MRRPIVSKSERSGTGVDMANFSKAVCHGESDKCRFGNPPQESNFQRLGIRPAEEIEAMLAVQMVATHETAMDMLIRAKQADLTSTLQECGSLAVKLLRTYTAQVDSARRRATRHRSACERQCRAAPKRHARLVYADDIASFE